MYIYIYGNISEEARFRRYLFRAIESNLINFLLIIPFISCLFCSCGSVHLFVYAYYVFVFSLLIRLIFLVFTWGCVAVSVSCYSAERR